MSFSQKQCLLPLRVAQVETFVESDAVHGAVRSSMAGMAHRRSIQKVRSNLITKVCGLIELDSRYSFIYCRLPLLDSCDLLRTASRLQAGRTRVARLATRRSARVVTRKQGGGNLQTRIFRCISRA